MKSKVSIYIILAYAITWLIAYIIVTMYRNHSLSYYELNLYHSFAAIGPAIGAIVTTFLFYGKEGIRTLLSKLKFPRLKKTAVFIVCSPIFFFLIGIMIFPLIKSEFYSFGDFADSNWSTVNTVIVWILPLLTYSIFEEIGWRGFLLPHLQEKYTAFKATAILAVIWALWHLPFFFYRFDFSIGISIGFFFGIFVGAIILTSIYNSSRGFLIPAMLFHFLNNLCSEFDKEIIVAVLSTGFICVAIFIYKKYGKEDLSSSSRVQKYF